MGRVASTTKMVVSEDRLNPQKPLDSNFDTHTEINYSSDPAPLTHRQLIDFYRLMYTSRRIDDREIMLKRQQKIFFQISAAGHEALQVAAAMAKEKVVIGRVWKSWPNHVRVTVGLPDEMEKFKAAFLKVMA